MGILLYWVVLVFEHFILYESFVTNCQRGRLLDSKSLEQLTNREHTRTYKLQKEDFRIRLVRLIEEQAQLIESRICRILIKTKQQFKPIKD